MQSICSDLNSKTTLWTRQHHSVLVSIVGQQAGMFDILHYLTPEISKIHFD